MVANSFVIIQNISVVWTKAARGGDLATKRNKVPERLKIPATFKTPKESSYICHTTDHGGWYKNFGAYTNQVNIAPLIEPYKISCIGIYLFETLEVRFEGAYQFQSDPNLIMDYEKIGAPRRRVPLRPLNLKLGEWGQIKFNGRNGPLRTITRGWDDDTWYYSKEVINIGWFSKICLDVFVETEPTSTYSNMAELW